jgi:hypothetical protein
MTPSLAPFTDKPQGARVCLGIGSHSDTVIVMTIKYGRIALIVFALGLFNARIAEVVAQTSTQKQTTLMSRRLVWCISLTAATEATRRKSPTFQQMPVWEAAQTQHLCL